MRKLLTIENWFGIILLFLMFLAGFISGVMLVTLLDYKFFTC